MRIAYLDESGSPELKGSTSHFVLLALTIDGETWKSKDRDITRVKNSFGLSQAEVHAGWMARRYPEQEQISGFSSLNQSQRRSEVRLKREAMLLKRATLHGVQSVQGMKKSFRKTESYIHLTFAERREVLKQILEAANQWPDCRLFAECTDKRAFGSTIPTVPPFEEAFTQVISRFHRFLLGGNPPMHGMLVQDHNQTVAERLTGLMRRFHSQGTPWASDISQLIETPLFVDSRLTSLVQVADVCAYATRRYLENQETELFNLVLPKFHYSGGRLVSARHYRGPHPCDCLICRQH